MAGKTLKYQAYEKIKAIITSHQISHGDPITELELSKTLGMGRSPIREALNLLSKDGLIQLIPNKGAILRKFSLHDLIQIYQIREVLDPLAAKQSAGKIDLSKLEKIEKKYLQKENPNWETGLEFSQELHSIIYRSCGNSYLIEFFENLRLKIDVSRHSVWNLWTDAADTKVIERRNKEHAEIIRALKEKDAEKAENLSRKHISNAIQEYLRLLKGP